jgi:hypothetical protein
MGMIYMKTIMTLCLLLSISTAWAAKPNYEVKMNLALEGFELTLPPVQLLDGETKSLKQQFGDQEGLIQIKTRKLTQIPNKGEVIRIHLTISLLDELGQSRQVAQTTIISKDGQLAQISDKDEEGNEKLGIALLVERLDL